MGDKMDTTGNFSLGLPINNAAESSYFGYSPYYPTYSCYQDKQDYSNELANKKLIYRSIPYYNNELKSLEDIDRSDDVTNQMVSGPTVDPMANGFYTQGSIEPLPTDSYNNQALNTYGSISNLPSDNGNELPDSLRSSGHHYGSYERHNSFYSGNSDFYSGRNGDVKKVKLSDLIKLTEAMRELTSRLPMPPSPELLQSINPNLAATLQLTYLKAYIQNQQLLLDLKSTLEGSFPVDGKYTLSNPSISEPNTDLESFGLSLTKIGPSDFVPNGLFNVTSLNYGTNALLPKIGNVEIMELHPSQTTHPVMEHVPKIENVEIMEHVPKISDVSGDDHQCVDSINTLPDTSDYLRLVNNTTFPKFGMPLENKVLRITNGEQVTRAKRRERANGGRKTEVSYKLHYPSIETSLDGGLAHPPTEYSLRSNDLRSDGHHYGDYSPIVTFGEEEEKRRKGELSGVPSGEIVDTVAVYHDGVDQDKGSFSGLVPKELKKFVKYDNTKNSYVAVFLGPTGLRKRKAFSVRKFGVDGALKRAETFALGSSGVTLAVKERGLLEQICTSALQLNPKSRENIKLYEHALMMEHYRGLVYSCGGQMWLSVYYDSLSKRGIKGFLVSEYGFQGAYDAAKAFLETREHTVQSKLSGALSFWLENDVHKTLCLIVPLKGIVKQICPDNDHYGQPKGARRISMDGPVTTPSGALDEHRESIDTHYGRHNGDYGRDEEMRVCIGRFELDVHGGFVKTRKVAQDWCNAIKSGNLDVFCTGSNGPKNGDVGFVNASKLPGVVYESSIDCWITNCNGKGKRFYVKSLGTLEARRKAILYRNNFLNTQGT